jgi:hypothetical protein
LGPQPLIHLNLRRPPIARAPRVSVESPDPIAAFLGHGVHKADLQGNRPLRGLSGPGTRTEDLLEPEGRLSRHPCRWRTAAAVAVAVAVLPILLLAACGSSSQGARGLRSPRLVGTCASRTCASVTAILHGGLPGSHSARAYVLYVDGRQRGVQQAPPFDFGALHCGTEYGLMISERRGGGPDRTVYATRYRAPACRGFAVVGADGVPHVACDQTVGSGADLGTVLSAAVAGSTICLSAGSWGRQVINNVNPAGMVTVASAPGQTAEVGGVTLASLGAVSNLTFEGIRFSGGVEVDGPAHSLLFRFDDFQDIPDDYAFNFKPFASGRSAVDDGVTISYNQIDHVGECLQMDGGESEIVGFTFSHNVCGPGIGYEEDRSFGAHYIQTDGVNGFDVVSNAFEGPPDPRTVTYGNHLNVLHVWGSSRDIDFSSNVIWHTRAIGQMLLLGDNTYPSRLDGITVSNNLDVEDPACGPGSKCPSYAMYSLPVHGMTWTHNTDIGSVWGVGLGWRASCTSACYASSTDMTAEYNLASPVCGSSSDCNQNYTAFACEGGRCAVGHNVSADGSANSARGGRANVVDWRPLYATTAWTPKSGSPWNPPPAGYYRPLGLPYAAGYQGTLGP